MNCSCGCKTAEHCWKNCCCFSQQEKIAWAAENGVTPPAYVLALVEKPRKSCCGSCCSSQQVANTKPVSAAPRPAAKRLHVIAIQALQCQGITYSLSLLPPSLVPAGNLQVSLDSRVGFTAIADDLRMDEPFCVLDTPPPEPLV